VTWYPATAILANSFGVAPMTAGVSFEPEGLNFSTPITVDLPSEVSLAEGGT
jgi:hypothetical protein